MHTSYIWHRVGASTTVAALAAFVVCAPSMFENRLQCHPNILEQIDPDMAGVFQS